MSKLSKLFRHFDISLPICRNAEIVSTCRNCRNSDWSIVSTCRNLSKLTNITTINCRKIIYNSLERSHRAESNGGEISFLWAIGGEILSKTSKSANSLYGTAPFVVLHDIYGLSNRRKIVYSSLERSYRAESKGGKISFLWTIGGEISRKTAKIQQNSLYDTAPFYVLLNISPPIVHRNEILPPLDSAR